MPKQFTPLEIGETIKNYRKAKGLTQGELGKMLNVVDTAVSKYEKGQIANIPLEIRLKLATILDIPTTKLNIDRSFFIDEMLSELYGVNKTSVLTFAEIAHNAIINYLNEVHKTDAYYPIIERQEYWLIDKSAYSKSDILQLKYLINTFLLSRISDTEFQQIKTYTDFVLSQRKHSTPPEQSEQNNTQK